MRSRSPDWRLTTVAVLSFAAVCVIFLRIVQVQIIEHEEISEDAWKQWVEEVREPGAVAPPTDRRGFLGVNYGDVDAATAGRVGVGDVPVIPFAQYIHPLIYLWRT